nr:isopentenyl-diphosphate Delta-isomerase [Pseudonocardia spinosispora]
MVLLDEAGRFIGSADKATVHHAETPLHLAFSCYLSNSRNEVLMTRRSARKKTWPGVWTNSCCGHPAPGETLASAVLRRLREELGVTPTGLDLILPEFRYRAVMGNGVVENELCPVFRAYTDETPTPDPDETDDFRWVEWAELCDAVTSGAFEVSPWCREQVQHLLPWGTTVCDWPTAPDERLPPAAPRSDVAHPECTSHTSQPVRSAR